MTLRTVFALAAVAAAVAVAVLVLRVREPRADEAPPADTRAAAGPPPRVHDRAERGADRHPGAAAGSALPHAGVAPPAFPRRFWGVLGAVVVFTLGNSTDAFLLLRATQLGVAPALLPILWAMLHVVKSASSTPGGALSDRVGRKPLIVAGWLLYAAVYYGFARADAAWQAWALFGVYGLYFGLTEGSEKALVADLVGARHRGRAFGWYNLAIGIAALPASLLFGLLWDRGGPVLAFTAGAGVALVAALAMGVAAPPAGTHSAA